MIPRSFEIDVVRKKLDMLNAAESLVIICSWTKRLHDFCRTSQADLLKTLRIARSVEGIYLGQPYIVAYLTLLA
jgi:hypothetical protein